MNTTAMRPRGIRSALTTTAAARLTGQACQVLTFLAASRWLGPEAYGEYAVILAVTGLALLINDFGLQASLVFSDDLTQRRQATAFWTNASLGIVLCAAVWLLSRPIASAVDQPRLVLPLCVASISFVTSLSVVPAALLERDLRFEKLALCELSGQIAASFFIVVAAWRGLGIYSLSISLIVNTTTVTVLLLTTSRYIPVGKPGRREFRELWGFSSGMMGFGTVNYAIRNLDNVLLSRFGSPTAVGLYSRAYSLTTAPVTLVGLVIGRVLFPILTRLRDAPELMRERWTSVVAPTLGLAFPGIAVVVAVAPAAVHMIFPAAWADMGTIVSILAVSSAPQIICACFGCVFQAVGQTKVLFYLASVQLGIFGVALFVGVHHGAQGTAVAVAIASLVYMPIPVFFGSRVMGLTWGHIRELLRPATILSCACVIAIGASVSISETIDASDASFTALTIGLSSVALLLAWWSSSSVRNALRT